MNEQSLGTVAARRGVFEKMVKAGTPGVATKDAQKKLDTYDIEDGLTDTIQKYVDEYFELHKVAAGHDQKGQDTYRNSTDPSMVRVVPVSLVMADPSRSVPETLAKSVPKEKPIHYKTYADLIRTAPILKKTIVPV